VEIIARTAYSVDDMNGQTVEANALFSRYYGQAVILLDTEADALYDKKAARLTPAAARALAAQLLELADKADEIDAERA
jgi:hypothetical protein